MKQNVKRFRSLKIHKILLGFSIGCILVAIVLLWLDGLRQPYIGDDFSYTSDIITSDNYYDVEKNRFAGSRYLTPVLQIDSEKHDTRTTISSKLVSKTVGGESVATIERDNAVDPQTGQYLDDNGQPSETSGYVFAPKNLNKNETFYYRHITYDSPAQMRFAGEETIHGLDVYRYDANYSESAPLLINDLPTPNIPENQSLEYEPKLQIWVEPKSGWLIKFQEDTTIYLYDDTNGHRITPALFFSSHTEDQSVEQQVAYAKNLKLREIFVSQIAPSIILVALAIACVWLLLSRVKYNGTIPIKLALAVIIAIPAILLVGWMIGILPLQTFFLGSTAMNPLGAFCFLFVALAIWAIRKRFQLLVTFIGGILLIFAGLQLLGILNIVPFHLDLLFFRDNILALGTNGRMSAYTAFTFIILGGIFIKSGLTTPQTPVHFAKFASGMVAMLGVFGLLIQILQIDQAFTITFIQPLSVTSSFLFAVCGFTLMQLFRHLHYKPDDIKSTLKALMWPSLATIPIIVIGAFAQIQQNNIQRSLQANLNENVTSINGALSNRMDIYTNTLIGARALFASSDDVTSQEWSSFVQNYELQERYPGILDVGFAQITNNRTLDNNSTNQTVEIFPQTDSDTKVPIVYIEPLTQRTLKQIGFDMLSDTVRGNAIEQARDSGMPRLSDKLSLPDDHDKSTDLLLLAPVYSNSEAATDPGKRQDSAEGYVFASINLQETVDSVINGLSKQTNIENIDFEIYDGLNTNSEALMYRRYPTSLDEPRLAEKSTIFLGNKPWTIVYAAQPDYQLSSQEEYSPTLILLGGTVAYLAILAVIFLVVDLERKSKAERHAKSKKVKT